MPLNQKFNDFLVRLLVLTHLPDWSEGKVIDVENNMYNGIVVSAETDDGSIYFQRAEYFKKK